MIQNMPRKSVGSSCRWSILRRTCRPRSSRTSPARRYALPGARGRVVLLFGKTPLPTVRLPEKPRLRPRPGAHAPGAVSHGAFLLLAPARRSEQGAALGRAASWLGLLAAVLAFRLGLGRPRRSRGPARPACRAAGVAPSAMPAGAIPRGNLPPLLNARLRRAPVRRAPSV